jgi:hypothetical protein
MGLLSRSLEAQGLVLGLDKLLAHHLTVARLAVLVVARYVGLPEHSSHRAVGLERVIRLVVPAPSDTMVVDVTGNRNLLVSALISLGQDMETHVVKVEW